jgi:hypothetical protein
VRVWGGSPGLVERDAHGKETVWEKPMKGRLTYLLRIVDGHWLLAEETGEHLDTA